MTTLSVFTQDQLLSDSSMIHSGETMASTGVDLGALVPGVSENAPASLGDPAFTSVVPAGDTAEIAVRTPDLARLDFAPGDKVFLVGFAPGRFKGVRPSDDFEEIPEGARALGLDLLPDGSGEGYQIS